MTRHTSFSSTEWALLGDAPMAAAAAVALASAGGGRSEARAMVEGWREAGSHFGQSELMAELVARLDPEQRQSSGSTGYVYPSIEDEAVGLCREAVELLRRSATPAELEEYRAFVIALAEHVAEAHREGGLIGLGGAAMSREERAVIGMIAGALAVRQTDPDALA